MNRFWRNFCAYLLVGLLLLSGTSQLAAQTDSAASSDSETPSEQVESKSSENQQEDADKSDETSSENADQEDEAQNEPGIVKLDNQELFVFEFRLARPSSEKAKSELTPKQRAENASEEIQDLADNYNVSVDEIVVERLNQYRFFIVQDDLLFVLANKDAEAAGVTLDELAADYLETLKTAITEYRDERSPRQRARAALSTLIATVLLFLALAIVNKFIPFVIRRIDRWQNRRLQSVNIQDLEVVSERQISRWITNGVKYLRIALIAVIFYNYISLVLGFFPETRGLRDTLFTAFWQSLALMGQGIIGYLPNLIRIIIFVVVGRYAVRVSKIIFDAIRRERVKIPGFYTEWAQPTSNIATVLIVALTAVLIFPYLPASDSAGFQGVSIFLGALVTLGSTGAIANIISGIVIIYTRAFQLGDRIEVSGVKGDVIDKTILSTQIITPENEIVTIPNASLIASNIRNYSAAIRNLKKPLVLKTTVTLGYDVPWRKVHAVLTDAALATEGILPDPQPHVWQVSLDDYYPSYNLRAFTNQPNKMGGIYSALHQNIQDKCNEADIEILSPQYHAVRDGNQNTMPAEYLGDNYQAPGFRLDNIDPSRQN
ncbi:MAG: mechanosensitive ion channel domain-containing protein [Cyanobacteria bacterium P01_H01_bin.15]